MQDQSDACRLNGRSRTCGTRASALPALDGIGLTIRARGLCAAGVFARLGPSGCGKSILLRLMLVTVPCRVNPLVRSTALLFDPAGAVNGRIIMAARYPGVPRCRENPDGMQRVPELPETQTAWVKSCDGETKEVLVSGATVVPMRCNGYAMRARGEKPGIVYVCPKDGYTG